MRRYSFLGPSGTFTEAALLQVPGADQAERVPAASVLSALTMVDEGTVDGAMVPIENSVEGGVTATLDAVSVAHNLLIITCESMMVPIGSWVVNVKCEVSSRETSNETRHNCCMSPSPAIFCIDMNKVLFHLCVSLYLLLGSRL